MSIYTDFIGKTIKVTIDRPINSMHPWAEFKYKVNYGYITGTMAEDGEPIDAYVLGPTKPLKEFIGICIAVIHRFDDEEDKLVVAERPHSDSEIRKMTDFQEKFFKTEIIRSSK